MNSVCRKAGKRISRDPGAGKQEDAEIYWGDETGLRNDCKHERGYAPKDKTPVIRLNAKRESINIDLSDHESGQGPLQVL